MAMYWHLLVAGLGPIIFHWGLPIGLIILCLAGAYFSSFLPIISHFKTDFIWVAACIGVFLVGEGIGLKDGNDRCKVKSVVIEKHVKGVVDDATTNLDKVDDPYDKPDN